MPSAAGKRSHRKVRAPRPRALSVDTRPSALSDTQPPSAHSLKDVASVSAQPSAVRGDEGARDGERLAAVRTPSPTPSETGMLEGSIWNPTGKRKTTLRDCMNQESLVTFTVVSVIIACIVVFLVFQQRIIDAMKPFGDWLHRTQGAWLIPIAILFVLSFPPLFGSGIIAILCGVVWGIWIGFGIVAAGTVLGELGNFYLFKWMCGRRGPQFEEKYLMYALWSEVVRDGGFFIPTIMRYTSYPGHFLTAIFATCGMSVWAFLVSALLSAPKQLATVYLGVAQGSHRSLAAAQAGVTVAVTLITYLALWVVGRQIDKVKAEVIYRRRKARQARLERAAAEEMAGSAGLPDDSASSSARGLVQPA